MDVRELHEGNREAWDRTARSVYESSVESDIQFIREGGSNLMEAEIRLLGKPSGRAIHLQCSHGLDALSLLKLGLDEVVGVDISEEMLAQAKRKSDALGARATWIRSDVLQTPDELNGTADLVYTGKGAICWIMDIDAWAAVVARLLKPGGGLFLFEGHPLDFVWEEDAEEFVPRPDGSYFVPIPGAERGFPYEAALRADPAQPVNLTSRVWTIGEVITALVNAGLRINRLEEFPEPFWDQFKRIPPGTFRNLPHTFAVLATKL
jgi:SAM-dependent methyltransferase